LHEAKVAPRESKRAAREQAQGEQMRRECEKTVAQLAELWMQSHARLHKRRSW
jgi:hypothetical protein